jgi:3-methyladenine DNA glycosylase Tag
VTAAAPPAFAAIHEGALERHGASAVEARLATPKTAGELRALPDDRYLSQMSLRIFRAGLKHELVDRKWLAFEDVFHGFDPERCAALYDEDLEAMIEDRRLIRHMGKLRAVRGNARAMLEVAREHGSFGAWLAGWPADDVVSLWEALAKRFSQLGGNSAPMFLRMVGKDTFIVTDSVAGALRRWGVVDGAPTTKADRAAVQRAFNAWAGETGRPLCQLSQILAMSAD